jgi:hypothetical protein
VAGLATGPGGWCLLAAHPHLDLGSATPKGWVFRLLHCRWKLRPGRGVLGAIHCWILRRNHRGDHRHHARRSRPTITQSIPSRRRLDGHLTAHLFATGGAASCLPWAEEGPSGLRPQAIDAVSTTDDIDTNAVIREPDQFWVPLAQGGKPPTVSLRRVLHRFQLAALIGCTRHWPSITDRLSHGPIHIGTSVHRVSDT